MTRSYTKIQLHKLPALQLIDEKNSEEIFEEMKADLIDALPNLANYLSLESEPVTIALQQCAWREYVLRQRINHAAKSVTLANAGGTDLANLAALFGVERQQISEDANLKMTPNSVDHPHLFETDDYFRRRVQLALEGFTNAGSIGAYTFHALSASGNVKDASIESPAPGEVKINVLSRASEQGEADQNLLDLVAAAVNADDVRPLTDQVSVNSATILPYEVEATLNLHEGPDPQIVKDTAQKAIEEYVVDQHNMGRNITISGIYAALHQVGVNSVDLIKPTETIEVAAHEAAFCTKIDLNLGTSNA